MTDTVPYICCSGCKESHTDEAKEDRVNIIGLDLRPTGLRVWVRMDSNLYIDVTSLVAPLSSQHLYG